MTDIQIPEDVLGLSRYFDHLVELIPARFYHEEEAPVKLRFLPKDDRQSELDQRKAKAKANKLAKLDPERAQTALQRQRQGGNGAKRKAADSDQDVDDTKGAEESRKSKAAKVAPAGEDDKMVELREKLQKRLEVFRTQRKADEKQQQTKKAREYQEKRRKASVQPPDAKAAQKRKQPGQPSKHTDGPGGNAPAHLSYGMLDFGEDGRQTKRQKKLSKAEMLQEAERKASAQAQDAATADGQARLRKEAWGSALQRAKGDKIYDDPKLLRRSLKKDEKQRSKSAAAWKERDRLQQQEGKDRQQKRRENLQARVQAKQQKRVSKREEKLLRRNQQHRPGFEGRRDTFINR